MEAGAKEAQKVGQEQIHDLLFGEKLSWQAIIYDLINTEQLNPWDIDISLLSQKYLDKVRQLEAANFFVSSKVLLAASLLLRIKSEILLNRDIPGLDEVLFGRKEHNEYKQERIELDEDVPGLIARTPLPRLKKVTLQELMAALGNAIKTENRRIKRIVVAKQYEIEAGANLPKQNMVNLRDKIREIYSRLKEIFENKEDKLSFSEFIDNSSNFEDKVAHFVSLLHLDYQHKIWLEQDGHLADIFIWLKEIYESKNKEELDRLKKEVEEVLAEGVVADKVEEKIEGESVFDDLKEEGKRVGFESSENRIKEDEVEYENPFGKKSF